jgi:transcriptional regulator
MYIPKFNAVSDPAVLHALMRQFSFATLVTTHDGAPFATHLPFLIYPDDGPNGKLVAHMARANKQWHDFERGDEALVIFQGAHAYISPTWYTEPVSVPTWNYAVVHAYGVPRVIEKEARVRTVLRALVDQHESGFEEPWTMDLPEDYLRRQMLAIVAFEIPITRIEGKLKLSQNRSAEDQRRVVEALSASDDANAQVVGTMMREQLSEE